MFDFFQTIFQKVVVIIISAAIAISGFVAKPFKKAEVQLVSNPTPIVQETKESQEDKIVKLKQKIENLKTQIQKRIQSIKEPPDVICQPIQSVMGFPTNVRAHLADSFVVPRNKTTVIPFDTEDFDDNNEFNPSTYRFVAGEKMSIHYDLQVGWIDNPTENAYYFVEARINERVIDIDYSCENLYKKYTVAEASQKISGNLKLEQGDYVDFSVMTNQVGGQHVAGGYAETHFYIFRYK